MEWRLDPSLDWSSRPGPAPPPPLDKECPGGQSPINPLFAHDYGEPRSAPSLQMDTECLGSQPPMDPLFTHGHKEPRPRPSPPKDMEFFDGPPLIHPVSPPMDMEFPGGQLTTHPVFAHGHGESYPVPSLPMDTKYPGRQPPTDPVFAHGHGEPNRMPSPPMDTKFPSGQPSTNPVFTGYEEPYPSLSPPMDTIYLGGQPPIDPVFTHGNGEPRPVPSPPKDMEVPNSQQPINPVCTHGHGESYPAPSLPMDTEYPGGQPRTDPMFTHDYGEPYLPPSPPMDTEYLDGQPQTDPMFTHRRGEPYPALSPLMDTEYPGGSPPTSSNQRMSMDSIMLRELNVVHFRRVNSLIRHERFDELLELIKIDGSERQPVNLMKDPVLSVVISTKKTQLAVKLIERAECAKLRKANIFGDTPLHIAAIEGDTIVAKALLQKDPSLMEVVNLKKETALHKAAMYGQESMFWCLVHESQMVSAVSYRNGDGSNVLHCAIMGNAPKLALDIAKTYTGLILSRGVKAVTPLQLMVTIPNFFRSQLVAGPLESFLYKLIPLEEDSESKIAIADEEAGRSINVTPTEKDEDYYGWKWKSVRSKFPSEYTTILDLIELIGSWLRHGAFKILKLFSSTIRDLETQKKRYAAAMQLVEYLANDKDYDFYCKGYSGSHSRISNPTSSYAMRSPSDPEHASGEDNQEDDDATETTAPAKKLKKVLKEVLDRLTPETPTPSRWTEPPLIIAAERGLHDFVRKILQVCPQSATYLDSSGRNVLQVAIESGHKEVVSVLSEMLQGSNPILPSWLCSKLDNKGTKNTILHLAAEHSPAEEGDAVQLHHELKWFEMVEKLVPKELANSRNRLEKTAKELFTEKHEKTLQSCKNQLVDMGMMSSSLLAAVVFASSFSIPGDEDKESGKLAFKIFSHAYVIGFGCAATALVLFLSFVITPYKERYFRRVIPMQYFFACLSFALALLGFLISFVCNFVLQIYGGHKTHTTFLIPLLLELLLFPVTCIALLLYHGAKFGPSFTRFWK